MNQLTIGELAKRCQVHLETIRYYERQGLLSKLPRLPSGYRAFSPDAVRWLRFIKRSQEIGFSLKEIKELLALRIHPRTTCADVRSRAEAKIADINEKIRRLRSMKKALERLVAACSGGGPASDCPILESQETEQLDYILLSPTLTAKNPLSPVGAAPVRVEAKFTVGLFIVNRKSTYALPMPLFEVEPVVVEVGEERTK